MAHRHRVHKAKGGRVVYAGKGSNVEKEAEETGAKRGGGVHVGKVPGKKGKARLDKRARGGGVGSDKSPFSSAARKGFDTGREGHLKRGAV